MADLQVIKKTCELELEEPEDVFPAYKHAFEREDNKATLIIEHGNYYGQK